LACYQMMTASMLTAADHGRFHDPTWVRTRLHRFADDYFDALAAYEAQTAVPAIWQQAHAAAAQPGTMLLQNLFLGINAHINYDLVLALVDTLQADWAALPAETRQARYEDHCLVNRIIAETIDRVQDEVLEPRAPLLALLDWLGGPLDEFLVAQLISQWRDEVWRRAAEMLTTADPAARDTLRRRIEQTALDRGRAILGRRAALAEAE
ncbi:MAG: hypothetical protein KC425_26335, partial [Anaerolineales bacterium]|nr:hypothetical protein [Anaerolineales bacterium]